MKIDPYYLTQAIGCYTNSINAMTEAKYNLKSGIRRLEAQWKGESKDAYMNIKNADWEKGLTEHIDRLTFLRDQLIEVKKCYEDIQAQSNNI